MARRVATALLLLWGGTGRAAFVVAPMYAALLSGASTSHPQRVGDANALHPMCLCMSRLATVVCASSSGGRYPASNAAGTGCHASFARQSLVARLAAQHESVSGSDSEGYPYVSDTTTTNEDYRTTQLLLTSRMLLDVPGCFVDARLPTCGRRRACSAVHDPNVSGFDVTTHEVSHAALSAAHCHALCPWPSPVPPRESHVPMQACCCLLSAAQGGCLG